MDFVEKAKIRLRHWIEHSEHHLDEYESFARELSARGKSESASQVLEMARLTRQSNECLRKALDALS